MTGQGVGALLKKTAEGYDRGGEAVDFYKCPKCQGRLRVFSREDTPVDCPWGCERDE